MHRIFVNLEHRMKLLACTLVGFGREYQSNTVPVKDQGKSHCNYHVEAPKKTEPERSLSYYSLLAVWQGQSNLTH